jgi:beta-lactamase class A
MSVPRPTRPPSSPTPRRPAARPPRRVSSRRPPRRPLLPPLLLALVLLALAILAVRHLRQPSPSPRPDPTVVTAPSPSATTSTSAAPATTVGSASALQPLATQIASLTAPLKGTYGVWVQDLPTGASTGQHAQQSFVAASVIKFYILVALYEEVAKGQISLDEKITTTAADIQDFGTGSIRYDPVGTSYSLADLAQRAAKQSDNTAAYLITQRLGEAYIQSRTNAWGMTDTSIALDHTTPQDIGTLFAAVARRRVLPARSALDLLGLLTDTDFEDRLPALLPPYAVVSHKIGTEANGVMNDAGLVVLPTRSYVLAIMTDGTDPDQVIQAEQQLSQTVFQFESGLP